MTEKLYVQDGEIRREFTESEYLQYQLDNEQEALRLSEEEIKKQEMAQKKEIILNRLGITEEEAKLLLS